MYTTSDFRRGMKIMYNDEPYEIIEFHHHKPGKGAAIVRTKLKNLMTGIISDPTFRSGDKFHRPEIEEKEGQFLYCADNIYYFMDPASFEQYEVSQKVLGDANNFMSENLVVELLFFEQKALSIQLPNHVLLVITECDPAVKGDTVSGATKAALLSTGFNCQVPLFISTGETIKIDTRTGQYVERVKV